MPEQSALEQWMPGIRWLRKYEISSLEEAVRTLQMQSSPAADEQQN